MNTEVRFRLNRGNKSRATPGTPASKIYMYMFQDEDFEATQSQATTSTQYARQLSSLSEETKQSKVRLD